MFPQLMRTRRERNVSSHGPISPWSACVKRVFCCPLHFIWHALMFLTILCVALQLLSAVRQPRKSTSFDHQFHSLLTGKQDTQSIMDNLSSNQLAFHSFQWRDENESSSKNVDTTSAQHLTNTSDKISISNHIASKSGAPHAPKGELMVGQEVPKPTQGQIFSQDHQKGGKTKQPFILLSSDNSGLCQPKNHIVFLKTHKTASSTILNILYRYGDTHNLKFALPRHMYNQLFYPYHFMPYFVEGVQSRRVKEFHIMCNHMRFRGPEVKKVMPLDSFYFSILRNPVSMMESLFIYYKGIPAFRNFMTLEEFLLDNGHSYNASLPTNYYARNILTFDFGFNNSAVSDKAELDKRAAAVISAVERDFHLILISEYFDESMVLLRHALCWTLEDVVSFRLNSRSEEARKPPSAEMAEKVKEWSSLDWRLYQHFNSSFWKRVDKLLGPAKLQEEVQRLRAIRAVLEKTCLVGGKAIHPGKVTDLSLKPFQYGKAVIQGYNLQPGLDNTTYSLCKRLIMPELQYTKALYIKQFPDLAAKKEENGQKNPKASGKNAMRKGINAAVPKKLSLIVRNTTNSMRNDSNSQTG